MIKIELTRVDMSHIVLERSSKFLTLLLGSILLVPTKHETRGARYVKISHCYCTHSVFFVVRRQPRVVEQCDHSNREIVDELPGSGRNGGSGHSDRSRDRKEKRSKRQRKSAGTQVSCLMTTHASPVVGATICHNGVEGPTPASGPVRKFAR